MLSATEAGERMESKEWKGLNKNSKSFVKSATDSWGKIAAYQEKRPVLVPPPLA